MHTDVDAVASEKGLLHDREWMFVDEKGKFLTQRRYHKLALVHPKLVPSFENPTVIWSSHSGPTAQPIELSTS